MATWKPKKLSVTLESPEEAEQFLAALVASKTTHGSEHVEALIEATSEVLEPYKTELLMEQVQARDEAAKSW